MGDNRRSSRIQRGSRGWILQSGPFSDEARTELLTGQVLARGYLLASLVDHAVTLEQNQFISQVKVVPLESELRIILQEFGCQNNLFFLLGFGGHMVSARRWFTDW